MTNKKQEFGNISCTSLTVGGGALGKLAFRDSLSYSEVGAAASSHNHSWSQITNPPSLFNGDYNSLSNRPHLYWHFLSLFDNGTDESAVTYKFSICWLDTESKSPAENSVCESRKLVNKDGQIFQVLYLNGDSAVDSFYLQAIGHFDGTFGLVRIDDRGHSRGFADNDVETMEVLCYKEYQIF